MLINFMCVAEKFRGQGLRKALMSEIKRLGISKELPVAFGTAPKFLPMRPYCSPRYKICFVLRLQIRIILIMCIVLDTGAASSTTGN